MMITLYKALTVKNRIVKHRPPLHAKICLDKSESLKRKWIGRTCKRGTQSESGCFHIWQMTQREGLVVLIFFGWHACEVIFSHPGHVSHMLWHEVSFEWRGWSYSSLWLRITRGRAEWAHGWEHFQWMQIRWRKAINVFLTPGH